MLEELYSRDFGSSLEGPSISTGLSGRPSQPDAPWNGPAIVRKVYLFNPRAQNWPQPDQYAKSEIAGIEARLLELQAHTAGGIQFTGGELLQRGENPGPWIEALPDADAILAVALSNGIEPLLAAISDANIPVLLFAPPFSGNAWTYVAGWARDGKKGDVVASSDPADLAPYFRMFRTVHHMRKSKVVVIGPENPLRVEQAEALTGQFGTSFKFLSYEDLVEAYQAAELPQAEHLAEKLIQGALGVIEPSRDDVRDSMRMYLATVELLKREQANALAVDCHAEDRPFDLPAYPCIGLTKFNDQGLYGVCEGDLYATMTQLLVTSYSGRPGFVSDPVFDTSRNEIIHGHCVAPTAVHGVGGLCCQYTLRNHTGDNKSVAIQVQLPIGEKITIAKFIGPKEILVSTAHVAGNVDNDRGCRTMIATRVSDARKMLDNYAGGLHRVIFYGDYLESIERMGRLMGFKTTREL
jgi:hypothetical protein